MPIRPVIQDTIYEAVMKKGKELSVTKIDNFEDAILVILDAVKKVGKK
jgi:hypothetical protein